MIEFEKKYDNTDTDGYSTAVKRLLLRLFSEISLESK